MAINRTSPKKGKVVDIPTAPTIGTATAGAESATVAFTAATKGGPVTTYTALSSPGSITGTGSSSPITVSGLTAGTAYTFTVRGTNATGNGEYSSASNSITALEIPALFESIATTTVGAGGTSTITFSSIPSTYKHLQIRGIARSTRTDYAIDQLYTRFNSDSGSNYAWHWLNGTGAAANTDAGTSATSMNLGWFATNASASVTNAFGGLVIDILDYANTSKYKTVRTLIGNDLNGGGSPFTGNVSLISGLWQSTSAITSITFDPSAADFAQYSSFALYGIKG